MRQVKLPKRVTVKWLKRRYACRDQVAKFEKVFPRGTAVTPASLLKAYRSRLDISWLARDWDCCWRSDCGYSRCQRLYSAVKRLPKSRSKFPLRVRQIMVLLGV